MENLLYILLNGCFFATYAALHAFAAVFLLDKGFTSTQIGIVLAVSNIIAVFVQTLVTGIIDNSKKITSTKMILCISSIMGMGLGLLYFVRSTQFVIVLCFILVHMLQTVFQPLITALFFEFEKKGYKIKFGLARGVGSVSFALASMYLGICIEKNGVDTLMLFAFIMNLGTIIAMVFFSIKNVQSKDIEKSINKKSSNLGNPIKFLKKYPIFAIFLVGVFFVFFTNNMLCDFFIYVVNQFGANESSLGYAMFIQAFLELPAMVAVPFVIKKIKVQKIIIFSVFFFFLKTLLITLANNMVFVYIGQSFQIFSFAVFIPASAYYVNMVMDVCDQYKGQAFVMSAMTLSGVLSNLICGKIIASCGIATTLVIGSISTFVGMIIMLPILFKTRE